MRGLSRTIGILITPAAVVAAEPPAPAVDVTEIGIDELLIVHVTSPGKKEQPVNEVDVVRAGVEVIEYLNRSGKFAARRGGDPGVILLDLKMPRLDGLEVLRRLRDDPDLSRIPVVMLTSSREEREVVRSYELGVNAYVVKPVGFQDFIDAVRNLGLFSAVLNAVPSERARSTG